MNTTAVTLDAPAAVIALWWVALGLTVLVIVPLAVYLLHRTWRAARNIRRYTAEALEAGAGIADNAAAIGALEETVERAGPLVEKAGVLAEAGDELAGVLSRRAGQAGGGRERC